MAQYTQSQGEYEGAPESHPLLDSEILETWISISSFKYFRVIRIEKQIRPFFRKGWDGCGLLKVSKKNERMNLF